MYKKLRTRGGFIKLIIIFILVVATISYFGIDVASIVESRPVQAVWSFTRTLFTQYVFPTFSYIWDSVLRDFIWEDVTNFFEKAEEELKNTDIESFIDTTAIPGGN
ncbi:MAG: hypothetical protein BMS9Abin13_317 [Patescibacteria group bacterium]|nr:MAG: hypothetical protein BMS9Abin13_317 [Patescibacteria group bacterium]